MKISEMIRELMAVAETHGDLPCRMETIRLEGGKAKLTLSEIAEAKYNSTEATKICVVIRAES